MTSLYLSILSFLQPPAISDSMTPKSGDKGKRCGQQTNKKTKKKYLYASVQSAPKMSQNISLQACSEIVSRHYVTGPCRLLWSNTTQPPFNDIMIGRYICIILSFFFLYLFVRDELMPNRYGNMTGLGIRYGSSTARTHSFSSYPYPWRTSATV